MENQQNNFPEVKLGQYKGLAVTRHVRGISEKTLDIEMVHQTRMRATYHNSTEAAKRGSRVLLDFAGFMDGQEIPDSRMEKVMVVLGDGKLMPAAEQAIYGHKAGETFRFDFTYPAAFRVPELSGKTAQFEITLHSVAEKTTPELTEEFAQSAGYASLAAMREAVRAKKQKIHEDGADRAAGQKLLEMAGANLTVTVPEAVLARTGDNEKLGRLYTMRGKKATEVKELVCGDIGAIAKMDKVKTGDTLCDSRKVVALKGIPFAEPCYSVAIAPKTRGQDDKVAQGLNRLNEEDPSFSVVNNAETHQMVLSGAGDMQVDVLVSKLKTRFNVEVELSPVRVAYREKIRKTVQKQGRHKKQTGGSGQFGDVWIRFEPQTEQDDMIFAEEVFGGSVPKNFFPAVEKGLRESCLHGVLACVHGPLAGYPVVNLKAVLYDGSYHPVDSSEIAFKTAAQLAYKAALPEANPCLMEPVGELKVTVPDSYMGDVMGDLNKRRGRVMGMDPAGNGEQVITAEVPMGEMSTYAIDLRSMTQSRGTFTLHFVRYEDCPPAAQEKAIAEAKARNEE